MKWEGKKAQRRRGKCLAKITMVKSKFHFILLLPLPWRGLGRGLNINLTTIFIIRTLAFKRRNSLAKAQSR